MAETSKRNWPWKKKNQEKVASALDSVESSPWASPHNFKFFDEQDVSKLLSDHARVSDEAMTQWQHSELRLKQLSDKLNAAQTELTTKDILVKQHAKVAEEAVTGWEKAEAEACTMKNQLETAINQKLATEDRVSHLDGALKECMRQLRHVREEQEVRIHETIIKKTREYDKLRQDMEVKLVDASQQLQDARSEALDSKAEARAMSIALQERTKALAEVMNVKASAETENKILQTQLQSMEKDNSTLKYERHLLSKEVEIRNAERDCQRKMAENAGKNQMENVKKIAKLETECQKLRILVRKKLPGPAALAQMKIEVDALSSSNPGVDLQRKRSVGRSASTSPRGLNFPVKSTYDVCHDNCGTIRDGEMASDRLTDMDDELKMLKESLAKRDVELQASRLMCAKTASKLSNVEEQLEAAVDRSKKMSGHLCFMYPKQGLRNRHGLTDPWHAASASLAELTEIKKGSEKELNVAQLDLVDDFTEIERLAMATEKGEVHTLYEAGEKSFDTLTEAFEKKLNAKQKELEEANSICNEVSKQLMHTEEQLSSSRSRNSANEAALIRLQEKMDRLCDKQGEEDVAKDQNITKELEDLVKAQSISMRAGAANEVMLYDIKGRTQNGEDTNNGAKRSTSSRSSSELTYEVMEPFPSGLCETEFKACLRGSDLLTTVESVVHAVEALAQAADVEHELLSFKYGHLNGAGPGRQVHPSMQWKDPGLECRIHSLIGISNKLLHGETDMVKFLLELIAVVTYLVRICGKNVVHLGKSRETPADWESVNDKEDEPLRDSFANVALGIFTSSDVKFLEGLEDPEKDKREPVEIMVCLEATQKRIEGMNNQLHPPEKCTSDGSICHMGNKTNEISFSNTELDSDMLMLLNKVVVLEGELDDEKRQHHGMMAKYHESQQNIHSGGAGIASQGGSLMSNISGRGASQSGHESKSDAGEVQVLKERQIQSASKKLVECQRSVLDLGMQLKASSSPFDSLDVLYNSDAVSSVSRLIQDREKNRLQLRAEESHSMNYITSEDELTPVALSREDSLGWSNRESDLGPGSPFPEE